MTLGPHPKPWPSGPEYDVKLLEEGDTRNVVDKYRYWSREAIIADLDQSRHSFHIAIEIGNMISILELFFVTQMLF
ncbi:MAG: hypothetical protein Ct9H90mP30_0830 [Actinomycetota bacterium]|nr:MAG: hypothetical protein Ct9H90mP30_0830 [Actinomycetota bacterium]